MKNYIQDGSRITYANATGVGIASGDVVNVGDGMAAIASVDIADGESGACHVEGVYELAKADEALAQGVDAYWDPVAGNVTATAEDNWYLGKVWEAAIQAATVVRVKLLPASPIVLITNDVA